MRLKDHIGKLEYFCAVAESKSIKSASKKVFIGQPQLTKVIKQLEDLLGTQLIVRSAKGITLTRTGDQLYIYGKKILKSVDEAEFLIKSGNEKLKGEIRIGTYDSIARYFFPEFLKYISTTMPDVNLHLETGRSEDILRQLRKKQIDVAVIVANGVRARGIESKIIYSDSFGLYKSPTMEARFSGNLVYFPYPMNDTPAAMKKFGFDQSMVCGNLETVRALTEQSIGVGLLPHRVARQSVMSHHLVPYIHPKIKNNSFDTHNISICYSKDEESAHRLFILDEIERFLQIWHQN